MKKPYKKTITKKLERGAITRNLEGKYYKKRKKKRRHH
jgi:hypothetical protein